MADDVVFDAMLQWGLVLADEDADLGIPGWVRLDALQWGLVLADEDAASTLHRALVAHNELQWGLVLADEDARPSSTW